MKKGKKESGEAELSQEERELFLSAFYQGSGQSPELSQELPKSSTKKLDAQVSNEDSRLFMQAFADGGICKDKHARPVPPREVRRKRGFVDATIDLHGHIVDDAVVALLRFIASHLAKGHKNLLVVHGKGTGAVRYAVISVLDTHPHVHNYRVAPGRLGGEGATLVKIGRTRHFRTH